MRAPLLPLSILLCCIIIFSSSNRLSSLLTATENLALRKPAYQSSVFNNRGPHLTVDGRTASWSRCASTLGRGSHWLVIDLEGVYKISRVRLWNPPYHTFLSYAEFRKKRTHRFEVLLGRKFYPCRPRYIDFYDICAVAINDVRRRMMTLDCFNIKAQFIAITISYNPKSTPLQFCEVQVFGTRVPKAEVHRRPILARTPKPRAEQREAVRDLLLRGVRSVRILAYCGRIAVLGTEVEAVLFSPKLGSSGVVMTASLVGLGRVVVLANDQMFYRITQQVHYRVLWFNLIRWLASVEDVSEAKLVYANHPLRRRRLAKHSILFWNGKWEVPKHRVRKILALLKRNKISVIFALRPWLLPGRFEDRSFAPLLQEAGVWLLKGVSTWHKEEWRTRPKGGGAKRSSGRAEEPKTVVPMERILQKMKSSFDEFILGVKSLHNILSKLPTRLQVEREYDVKIKGILEHYEEDMLWRIPCPWFPTRTSDDKQFVQVYNELMLSQSLVESEFRAPGVDLFPGEIINVDDKLITSIVLIVGNYSNEYYSTGLYLPPGGTVNLSVLENWRQASDWSVHIGCHTDVLFSKSEWHRYPSVAVDYQLKYGGGLQFIFSPFGGLVWIKKLRKRKSSIKLRISGVVEAPYFDVRTPKSLGDWHRRRFAPGAWADLAGETIAFCVPSNEVRHHEAGELRATMVEVWDKVIKSDHQLRGSSWRGKRRERFVVDVQTSHGYGHSGYPMVGHLSWVRYMLNETHIFRHGSWGVCHEIGHNLQLNMWTESWAREVTNNIFCLYNFQHVFSLPVFFGNAHITAPARIAEARYYLLRGAQFSEWRRSDNLALIFFAQVAHHAGFGALAAVFRSFNDLPDYMQPVTDLAKRNAWLRFLTRATSYSMVPLFEFWGIEVSEHVITEVSVYRPFLPDDIFTRLAPGRVNNLIWRYYPVYRSMIQVDQKILKQTYRCETPADLVEISKELWTEV